MTNVFQELHLNLPRPCPGSAACSRTVLQLVRHLTVQPSVLDAGCRSGHQTMLLAEATGGHLFAVDGNESALAEVTRRARTAGLVDRVRTFKAPLMELPFAPESFDLVWSEAAVFTIGFEQALQRWRPLMKQGASMVISELSWRTLSPPPEALEYWSAAYPAMRSIGGNVGIVERAGLKLSALYTMPDEDWWTEYYDPLHQRVKDFRRRFQGQPEILAQLDVQQSEIDLFRSHSRSYGYVFYVMQLS